MAKNLTALFFPNGVPIAIIPSAPESLTAGIETENLTVNMGVGNDGAMEKHMYPSSACCSRWAGYLHAASLPHFLRLYGKKGKEERWNLRASYCPTMGVPADCPPDTQRDKCLQTMELLTAHAQTFLLWGLSASGG